MPKQVIISQTAKEDYNKIANEIESTFSRKSFELFISRFEKFLITISFHPRIFGYYHKKKNIRKYSLTKYHLILYRVKRREVEIITIVYSRQKPSSIRKSCNKNY